MLTDDLKFGWRQLIKSPGFSLTAILTLGLAIGANTAVFSLVDAVMLRPLPYPQPDRLARAVAGHPPQRRAGWVRTPSHTGAVWEAVRDQATSVDAAVFSGLSARISLVAANQAAAGVSAARQRRVFPRARRAAADWPRVLRATRIASGGPAVAVLSDRLWRSAFRGDAGIVGQTIC